MAKIFAHKDIKRFADEQNPVPRIELVVDPVVVEDTPATIAPHIRDIAIVAIRRRRAIYSYQKPPKSLLAFHKKRDEFYMGP